MDVKMVPVNVFGADNMNRLAEKGIHNHDDVVKRVRDTFTPGMDSLKKMTEQGWSVCDCYTNYQITTPMPKHLFGDSFGCDMKKDIGNHMRDYYAGQISDDELNRYFNDCCVEMRKFQAQQHRSSGNVDEDNRKIISEVYEVFAKSEFMNQLSLFTGWYAWQTGINNRFGNYMPDGTYWQYG